MTLSGQLILHIIWLSSQCILTCEFGVGTMVLSQRLSSGPSSVERINPEASGLTNRKRGITDPVSMMCFFGHLRCPFVNGRIVETIQESALKAVDLCFVEKWKQSGVNSAERTPLTGYLRSRRVGPAKSYVIPRQCDLVTVNRVTAFATAPILINSQYQRAILSPVFSDRHK